MVSFSAEDGNIHLLFGDEDEYYTENLIKLNLKQYLNYCLQHSGFTGIFFVQDAHHERGRYSVEMGSARSAGDYHEAESDGFLYRALGKKTVCQESLKVMRSGKEIGERLVFRHSTGESVTRKIHYMLRNRRSESRYAFVVPLSIFCDLYESTEARRELQEQLRQDYKTSVVILTSSMKADESFRLLTEKPHIFCSELFPEMKRILNSDENLPLYREMKNELGSRYHVLNQLSQKEILRLLQYIHLIDGKEIPQLRRRSEEEYAAVLYGWYHAPDFRPEGHIGLPPKENCHLSELGRVLRQDNRHVWTGLEAWISQLYEGKPAGWKLENLPACVGGQESIRHPIFAETGDIRRIGSAIQGIADLNARSLFAEFWQVKQTLLCPWSHPKQVEYTGINKMLKLLEEMKTKQIRSETTAISILDYLKYAVCSGEKDGEQTVFRMRCECYEEQIRCSSRRAELEQIKEEHIRRRNRYRAEFEETKRYLEELRKKDPLYDELIRRMMEGTVDSSYVALHAPEVNHKKGELVRLDKAIKNETLFINQKQEEILVITTSMNNLELTITELCCGKDSGTLGDVLQRAGQMLHRQGIQGERSKEELWQTADKIQELIEDLQKPTESDRQSSEIFAELMGFSGKKATYEI